MSEPWQSNLGAALCSEPGKFRTYPDPSSTQNQTAWEPNFQAVEKPVEQRQAGIVSDEVEGHLVVCAQHNNVLHPAPPHW